MKPPILIHESSDVGIYSSAKQASLHLESADVRANLYRAYDIDGFLLDISVEPIEVERRFIGFRWKAVREVIVIQDHYPKRSCSDEIRSELISYLLAMQYSQNDLQSLSLVELVQLASTYMPWKVTFA